VRSGFVPIWLGGSGWSWGWPEEAELRIFTGFNERESMQEIFEMAERLGQSLARTDEYQTLKRAIEASGDDRDLAKLQGEIQELEHKMESQLRGGAQPTEEQANEYEAFYSRLQANSSYQRLVAAQANFDKVVTRVNDTIHKGIQKGAASRIILT